jgi:excisionase family DNA binding protein
MPTQDADTEVLTALTVRQAAQQVGCSEGLVRKLVRGGEVPAERAETVTGFRYMIDATNLPVLAHKVAMRRGPTAIVTPSQKEDPHGEDVRAAELEAENARLRDELRWLRAQFEEAQATIARLALPSPSKERPGLWARLFGRT